MTYDGTVPAITVAAAPADEADGAPSITDDTASAAAPADHTPLIERVPSVASVMAKVRSLHHIKQLMQHSRFFSKAEDWDAFFFSYKIHSLSQKGSPEEFRALREEKEDDVWEDRVARLSIAAWLYR